MIWVMDPWQLECNLPKEPNVPFPSHYAIWLGVMPSTLALLLPRQTPPGQRSQHCHKRNFHDESVKFTSLSKLVMTSLRLSCGVGEQPCLSLSHKSAGQANGHHCVILFCRTLGTLLTCLAKSLSSSLQGCFVDLSIALDEIYWSFTAVGKGSDLLGALVPSNCNGAAREGFNKNQRLFGCHPKAIGKYFVTKFLASLLIDAWIPFSQVIKEFVGIQRLGCVSKYDDSCSAGGRGCRSSCLKSSNLSLEH